jgi:7-cyano-7-deazaguanine synthase
MCSINGAVYPANCGGVGLYGLDYRLRHLIVKAEDRGRDSWGYSALLEVGPNEFELTSHHSLGKPSDSIIEHTFYDHRLCWFLSNNRAEPTTEYVKDKSHSDIQPFICDGWVVVHNGVIANDKQLVTAHNLQINTTIDSAIIPALLAKRFRKTFQMKEVAEYLSKTLIGSYAMAIAHEKYPDQILLMTNYKPLYVAYHPMHDYYLFTSLESYLEEETLADKLFSELRVEQVEPYSAVIIHRGKRSSIEHFSLREEGLSNKALIVCSGGLDSTVVAKYAQVKGFDITLLHFLYKCRAESKEKKAVEAIAKRLDCPAVFIPTNLFKDVIGGSRLTETLNEAVAEGETGAEFAHEWVPARNLIMLSIAVGYAESKGFETIMLGNNLEESGAYPDNEMIFINKLNEVLPFAVQVNKRIKIEMPVGNLMKHEIVKLGLDISAPLDLSWSCYEARDIHCGNCGPCFMRKVAFKINHEIDPIPYENDRRCYDGDICPGVTKCHKPSSSICTQNVLGEK